MNYQSILFILLATGMLAGCGSEQPTAKLETAAMKIDSRGLMNKEDYKEVIKITDNIKATGKISEKDLNYMLALLKKPVEGKNSSYSHLRVAAGLSLLKEFGEGQQETIWEAFTPMFSSKDQNDQRAAVEMAKLLKKKEAVPLLVPLLDSPYDNVKKHAKLALEAQGYSNAAR